jgi:hypothetical protein
MATDSRVSTGVFVIAGFVVPVIVQLVAGWWLDSGRGVAIGAVLIAVGGALAALWQPARVWANALALAAGVVIGSAVVLFRQGPGTIWPIVLVFALMISTVAAFAGAAIGNVARGFARPAR